MVDCGQSCQMSKGQEKKKCKNSLAEKIGPISSCRWRFFACWHGLGLIGHAYTVDSLLGTKQRRGRRTCSDVGVGLVRQKAALASELDPTLEWSNYSVGPLSSWLKKVNTF